VPCTATYLPGYLPSSGSYVGPYCFARRRSDFLALALVPTPQTSHGLIHGSASDFVRLKLNIVQITRQKFMALAWPLIFKSFQIQKITTCAKSITRCYLLIDTFLEVSSRLTN
jgi:hypothetical protein